MNPQVAAMNQAQMGQNPQMMAAMQQNPQMMAMMMQQQQQMGGVQGMGGMQGMQGMNNYGNPGFGGPMQMNRGIDAEIPVIATATAVPAAPPDYNANYGGGLGGDIPKNQY
jgi:hypothetical protein